MKIIHLQLHSNVRFLEEVHEIAQESRTPSTPLVEDEVLATITYDKVDEFIVIRSLLEHNLVSLKFSERSDPAQFLHLLLGCLDHLQQRTTKKNSELQPHSALLQMLHMSKIEVA
jgi:hypothetical protein